MSYAYKAYLLESKNFNRRLEVARQIERIYFYNYFGDNEIIHDFAKKLIRNEDYKAADFLNRSIVALGDDFDPDKLITQIEDKFKVGDRYDPSIKEKEEVERERKMEEENSHIRSAHEADAGNNYGVVFFVFFIFLLIGFLFIFRFD